MDGAQTAFDSQYPYGFEIDMMKRSMEPVGGPDAKKARWSPTFSQNTAGSPTGSSPHDAFANYGYGPQAGMAQPGFNTSPSATPFGPNQLYSTPPLSINTQTNGSGMGAQLSPNSAAGFAQQQQQQPSPGGASPYGMNMLGFPYNGQMANFSQGFGQQRLPSLNIQAAHGYSPAALSAALSASTGTLQGRTVYIGNLPATASVDELLNLVHFGPLESIRVLPEKSCVFLSFLDGATAAAFHADATIKKLALHGQELKIGWGKPSPVPAQVALAITQSNASRNVYLGGLDENMTEEQLRDELSRFGLIDQVKIVRDKNIGFVHFLSIAIATKVVNTLPTEPKLGRQTRLCTSPMSANPNGFNSPFSPYSAFPPSVDALMAAGAGASMQGLNRTVYLGNIHPETTTEDLCNSIRGGVLQSIRYMQDKHIAFVTFVDPAAAFTAMTINNRRPEDWMGKEFRPFAPDLRPLAVHSGATRNVYIGNVEDFETFTEERLKRDFGEYGDIELVNFLKEKNCAFVNFTNISNATKAIEAIKSKPESGPQGASGGRRSTSGAGAPEDMEGVEGGDGDEVANIEPMAA
ncbi:uncharacterized protein EV420DRAFT_1539923 [Desarmillaria tabescens]|uniref:RRM domain-containing protein n=1 Tax=Armillaria tabescens TaxID=1929756 RepID=A0AA39N6N4_ARMTA|nr:uncharacterized protein EV420DRAFT_1539923 [Desarmillaria tabescens]KAK0459379.1 hypothetical protein EV420DRAFT_1539923 [Desarmillaria tabescens]